MMKTSCNCLLKVIGLVIHFRIMPISCLTIKFFWLVFVLIYLCNYNKFTTSPLILYKTPFLTHTGYIE